MLEDLMQRTLPMNNTEETLHSDSNKTIENDEDMFIATGDINYCNLVSKRGATRAEMESLGHTGKQKQALQVNRKRGGGETNMECTSKWSICTSEMTKNKSTLTPHHLPVQVCGVIYCWKSGNI
jgi:hypothetical protein